MDRRQGKETSLGYFKLAIVVVVIVAVAVAVVIAAAAPAVMTKGMAERKHEGERSLCRRWRRLNNNILVQAFKLLTGISGVIGRHVKTWKLNLIFQFKIIL